MSEQQKLPTTITSKADIARLLSEMTALEQTLQQQAIRKEKTETQVSKQLQEVAANVSQKLDAEDGRKAIRDFLEQTKQSAPVVHISFASNPSSVFLEKITSWFRKEIHPLVLLQVGMQPSIAAGCTVRTTSKYFDLSLRSHLQGKNELLFERFKDKSHE
jgi:F0F1-type ATP synthase delta subunit